MPRFIQTVERDEETGRRTQNAIIECNRCKRHVELDYRCFTITCECGADYNSSGQELAPRSQWGAETGETAEDILAVDHEDYDPNEYNDYSDIYGY